MKVHVARPALTIAPGDTLPAPAAEVRDLEQDPTGASVSASLHRLGESEPVAEDLPAASGVVVSAGLWTLELRLAWTEEDTAALEPGLYAVRFRVELPAAAGVLTAPPDNRLQVRVTS